MRELIVRIKMNVPDGIDDEKAVELLDSIIVVGQADARESVNDDDIDNFDAELAAELQIGTPEIVRLYN